MSPWWMKSCAGVLGFSGILFCLFLSMNRDQLENCSGWILNCAKTCSYSWDNVSLQTSTRLVPSGDWTLTNYCQNFFLKKVKITRSQTMGLLTIFFTIFLS